MMEKNVYLYVYASRVSLSILVNECLSLCVLKYMLVLSSSLSFNVHLLPIEPFAILNLMISLSDNPEVRPP